MLSQLIFLGALLLLCFLLARAHVRQRKSTSYTGEPLFWLLLAATFTITWAVLTALNWMRLI